MPATSTAEGSRNGKEPLSKVGFFVFQDRNHGPQFYQNGRLSDVNVLEENGKECNVRYTNLYLDSLPCALDVASACVPRKKFIGLCKSILCSLQVRAMFLTVTWVLDDKRKGLSASSMM